MKKITIVLTVLIAITINVSSQIPNNGFENWPLSSNGYPVGNPIQSTDVYPVGIGNYSLKLKNNVVPNPPYSAFGFCVTFPFAGSWEPSFPITGHPDSFTGYFKYFPLNGDNAVIAAVLYLNGDTVSTAFLRVYNTVSSWSSFNIPFTSYISADSASIGFSAYNWVFGQTGFPVMLGNSELYIDNLNFDNLITSSPEQTLKNTGLCLYPNPASSVVTLNIKNTQNFNIKLNIYNVMGVLVKTEILKQNQQQINIMDLFSGIYLVEIESDDVSGKQKLIIQR